MSNETPDFAKFKRDPETGLLLGFPYKFKDDSSIDWSALLKPEHLYIPKDKVAAVEKQYGKSVKEIDVTTIEDKYRAVTLQGLRFLATVRGYECIRQNVDSVSYDEGYQITAACTHTCTIDWIGNYETNMLSVSTSDSAGASLRSVTDFMRPYIECASANRAFCRTVRFFLNLGMVSKEEIFEGKFDLPEKREEAASQSSTGSDPLDLLRAHMKSMGLDFSKLKDNIVKRYAELIKNSNPSEWTDLETIPKNDIFTIIGILVKSKESTAKK